MRIPLKTETDAFRVAVALGLLAGASIVVGLLASRAYGVVMFAAGVAAGVTFELAGRESDRGSALREAAHAPHPHGGSGGPRHILVVASETLAGEELSAELAASGAAGVELNVLAPILASRSHYWASDVDREREEAHGRLEASLAWAAEHGFVASGEVGDPDPLVAIADELRDFGADEVIIATHPRERTSWLARRMLGQLARELDVPVREIVVADDHDRSPEPPQPASG
jgi:GABA permease